MDRAEKKIYRQEILAMPFEDGSSGQDNFIVSLCNINAYNAIIKQKLWPNNRILILGEAGSGKSHLAKIWAQKIGAKFFKEPFERLYDISCTAAIVEDVDTLDKDDELFHLINYCSEQRIDLMMTARCMPKSELQDLRSRLNATHKILIKSPDDELVKILLYKYFSINQIHVDADVFDYIRSRIERSFSAITHFAELFNTMSLKQKRPITIPFVKSILG